MRNEYEELKGAFAKAKYGSFLLVPLKYDAENWSENWLKLKGKKRPFDTMDINESVKQTINGVNSANVISRYEIPVKVLLEEIAGANACAEGLRFYACEKDCDCGNEEKNRFEIDSLSFYVFHTQVAFLCFGIRYSDMSLLDRICNPGYVDSRALYRYVDKNGNEKEFSLDGVLEQICSKAGLECFFKNGSSLFLEGYAYNVAVVSERFEWLETMRQATFNLHLMVNLDELVEDESEDDVRYTYAVKDQAKGSYRWGCCVTSQTISYIVADENMDLAGEMKEQAENGVPVVLLAMYQKYTCLRFRELLSIVDKKKMKRLKQLRKQMLEFKVYGTIAPANLSRWHNVKQTYQYVLENDAVDELVEEISSVVGIVSEHQNELESARSNAVVSLITVFGVVSILDSLMSIVPALAAGDRLEVATAGVSAVVMAVLIGAVMLFQRRE